jgi:hypothetical protein
MSIEAKDTKQEEALRSNYFSEEDRINRRIVKRMMRKKDKNVNRYKLP